MRKVQHGVLLKKLDYSETSLILHFFTLEQGFQAFIFQGGKKKKGNILHALSLVEISSFSRKDSDLGKITQVNPTYVPQSILYNPLKSGIAFFMTEVLASVLRDSDADKNIFDFIEHEVKWIDSSDELTNYPLWFLLRLAEKLGIGIQNKENGKIFNLKEGTISNQTPSSPYFVNNESIAYLVELMSSEKTSFLAMPIPKVIRKELLDVLISYYQFHYHNFKEPKSIKVIQTVFD